MCHFNRKGVLVCIAYSTQFKLVLQAELNDGTFAPTLAKVGAQPSLAVSKTASRPPTSTIAPLEVALIRIWLRKNNKRLASAYPEQDL